ncbi:hypothetical protein NBRGN_068_00440 [Nocardia brasiliensis NBRC 14402]|uniref:hypothetical protein n=1 Tax=Nocardia brasiliensis TaxID=37326 RepID=UPI0003050436|nr:hypothetical protein [Nocardia brasiliensis]ASF06688.1 hypothetical protein CEQ30_04340 [Nocardia brasiliensis]GAJ84052.1 hypothetical protein NBRGN_068_00440 [Nocardia brasiliensis NBRC 14402]SUB48135.1 Uncharacterised protein [Nocardia brasiliensis]
MNKRQRGLAAVFGVALGAAAVTVATGTGTANAQGCAFDRQLTGATVTCPGDPARWGVVDLDCNGFHLTYGFQPVIGPYTQYAFGNLAEGVSVSCLGKGSPNIGLFGIVTNVRLR